MRAAPGGLYTVGILSLMLYLFVVHSYKLNIGSAVIAVGLFGVIIGERPIRFGAPLIWYAAFLGWALMTMPTSVDKSVSWDYWVDSLKIFLITFLAFNAIRTTRQHRLITLTWLGMFALYPVRGTLANFLTGNGDFGRYGWNFTFANFNDMAALTLLPLAMSLDRLRTADKKWIKVCALIGSVSLPFVILITQSRGGMLGMACMMLYLLARSRYRKKVAMAIVATAIVATIFAPNSVWERIRGMTYLTSVETLGQSDSSAEQRYLIWQVARKIIADNPVLGVGIGAYPIAHGQYARSNPAWAFAGGERDTHNTYLHVLAENGILGVFLFLMIFVSAFVQLSRIAKKLKNVPTQYGKLIHDRAQIYQSAMIGIAVCAVFGSLEGMVFPFLFIAISATGTYLSLSGETPQTARDRPFAIGRER
jgi:probable O-glycosylation ligase (exosortase A-associated)